MISKDEAEQERWDNEGGSGSYIGKDKLPELALDSPEADHEDLVAMMAEGIRALSDEMQIAERVRRLEAIKNEHEVQERAKAYRQVEGLAAPEDRNTCPHCGGTLTPPMYEVG